MKLRTRTARVIAMSAAALCVALLAPAAVLAATGSPAARPAPSIVTGCETPGLVIWLDTTGNGAAGSTFYHLKFTNLSGHACTLNGYPFLFAVSIRGRQLGRRASFPSRSTRPVTLKQGQTASALLRIVDVRNYPRSACRPVTAAGLRVFPPNQTRAKTVPFPFRACSKRGPHFLSVGRLHK